jgi:hypothetical protein
MIRETNSRRLHRQLQSTPYNVTSPTNETYAPSTASEISTTTSVTGDYGDRSSDFQVETSFSSIADNDEDRYDDSSSYGGEVLDIGLYKPANGHKTGDERASATLTGANRKSDLRFRPQKLKQHVD